MKFSIFTGEIDLCILHGHVFVMGSVSMQNFHVIAGPLKTLLRMFAANEKVFKLFSNHFFHSKIQHKTFENKINIG